MNIKSFKRGLEGEARGRDLRLGGVQGIRRKGGGLRGEEGEKKGGLRELYAKTF